MCNLYMDCGFGCKFHHVVYCLMFAYAKQRTLVTSTSFGYENTDWDDVFEPVTKCGIDGKIFPSEVWHGNDDDIKNVVTLPLIGKMEHQKFTPLSIPKEFSDELMKFHGNPFVWWTGQFLKYLWHPQAALRSTIDILINKLQFQTPIVGFTQLSNIHSMADRWWRHPAEKYMKLGSEVVNYHLFCSIHVRRTDKIGTEASFHSFDEYMEYVKEYYIKLEMKQKVDNRRVYIASDDPSVYEEARKKYRNYIFISNIEATLKADPNTRLTKESLLGIIVDIHLLARCNFVVCTFSSQICRVVYELMQTRSPDNEFNIQSLDDIYYFAGQQMHYYEATFSHKSKKPDEIDINAGDRIHILGNHWNGYSKGTVKRTEKTGLFPTFKARDVIRIADFP